jgi:hypothetical protein
MKNIWRREREIERDREIERERERERVGLLRFQPQTHMLYRNTMVARQSQTFQTEYVFP